jgi:cytochrome P450
VQQCPFPWYALLRESAPVFREPHTDWWFVSRHGDVAAALRRPEVLSSRVGEHLRPAPAAELARRIAEIRADGWPEVPVLVVEDPPQHRRQRVLVQRAFSPGRVASMEQAIREVAGQLVDTLPRGRLFDFVNMLATPFPVLVIADALRIPRERLDDFKRWSDNRVRMIGAELTDDEKLDIARSEVERQRYFAAEFDVRRQAPHDDLMTDLVHARPEADDGRPLSTEELLSIIGQVLAAGNESTTKVLTEIVHQLAVNPEAWQWVREDPAKRALAVADEGLRMACPFQISLRIALQPVTISGVDIPQGSVVALVLGSANRDVAVFAEPEAFTAGRQRAQEHLAFGHGIHRCVGANLARLELAVAVERLACRFERLEVAAPAQVEYEPSFVIRGIRQLPLTMH